uniref:UV excision repair protein RAD23 n=1 Tax=Globisporangium ultimum (strain ATCC 200006 / CBS 805.95 / DAOM BR144) TaxID=431595 RepID=K3WIJ7_GLOUD
MKLTVKTLQGVAFSIDAEPTDTVASVKATIEAQQSFPVSQQKLIHAGKVLKDESPLSEYNVKENDFLVVMVTKPKAPKPSAAAAAAPPAAAPAPAPTPTAAAPAAAPAPVAAPSTSSASSSTSAAPAVSTPSTAPAATATPAASSGIVMGEQVNAAVQQLVEMGFPEDQVRRALQAAYNNPDRAVEYLMNGIPEQTSAPAPSATGAAPSGDAANSLEALRNHPQFDALRQLIQSNPAALPAVLQQIGGQSPELLRLIHQNQDQFVQMLNEPITTPSSSAPSAGGAGASPFDLGGLGGGAVPTSQQIQQLVESLSPEQQAQMAAQMGMTPEQLRGLSQMLSNLPPGAMEEMMASMGGQGGFDGAGGAGGHRIMLTEEEAAAIDRLCDMGFDRNEAVQAYLACDKNEALAANFLMDSMSDSYGAPGGAGGGAGGDDNDDIYG